jgi:outer membrane protein assembly factor BamE (lipoprotein component of BamABCDE complex)
MKSRFAVFACLLLLANCTSTSGRQIDQAELDTFKVGQTTQSDVLAKLGQPTSSVAESDGTTQVTYSYVHTRTRAETFIPIAGAFVGGADSQSQTVVFTFDKNHRLSSTAQGNGQSNFTQGQ